jgi:hypothetical protein
MRGKAQPEDRANLCQTEKWWVGVGWIGAFQLPSPRLTASLDEDYCGTRHSMDELRPMGIALETRPVVTWPFLPFILEAVLSPKELGSVDRHAH